MIGLAWQCRYEPLQDPTRRSLTQGLFETTLVKGQIWQWAQLKFSVSLDLCFVQHEYILSLKKKKNDGMKKNTLVHDQSLKFLAITTDSAESC